MNHSSTLATTEQIRCASPQDLPSVASRAPLACDLTAMPPEQRSAHLAHAAVLLRTRARETQELPTGYAFRFAPDDYAAVVAFVANERHCCPFFAFTVEVTADRGPLWLRVTGPHGVKDFMQQQFTTGSGERDSLLTPQEERR